MGSTDVAKLCKQRGHAIQCRKDGHDAAAEPEIRCIISNCASSVWLGTRELQNLHGLATSPKARWAGEA